MDVDGLGVRSGMSIGRTTMLEEVAMGNWHKNSEWASPEDTAHTHPRLMENITQGLISVADVREATSGFPLKY